MVEHVFIHEPIFKNNCHLIIGSGNREEIVDFIAKKFNISKKDQKTDKLWFNLTKSILDPSTNGIYETFENGDILSRVVIICDKYKTKSTYTLDHELIHMISDIFEYFGIPHTRDTDEVYAYMYTYYKDELIKILRTKPTKKVAKNGNKTKSK